MTRAAAYCDQCGSTLTMQPMHGRQRPICSDCGHIVYFDPKVAAACLVIEGGRVLLVQRGQNMPHAGQWGMPAGMVEWDEDPALAAAREVKEEIGLEVAVTGLVDVFPRLDDGLADIVIVYRARVLGGTLQAADDAVNARWFSADELPQMAFESSRRVVVQGWSARLMRG